MPSIRTVRFRSDVDLWITHLAAESALSAARLVELGMLALREQGWRPYGPVSGPAALPEDVPQVPGLMNENMPASVRAERRQP